MITARDRRLFQIALLEARNSTCRYQFGALISHGNRIVSIAPNVTKTHPAQSKYHAGCITIHAELNAILKCQTSKIGATLYVARIGRSTISKPCLVCQEFIRQAGIRTIVYSDGKKLVKDDV